MSGAIPSLPYMTLWSVRGKLCLFYLAHQTFHLPAPTFGGALSSQHPLVPLNSHISNLRHSLPLPSSPLHHSTHPHIYFFQFCVLLLTYLRCTSSHENKTFRRSVAKQKEMVFGFRKTATAVTRPER